MKATFENRASRSLRRYFAAKYPGPGGASLTDWLC